MNEKGTKSREIPNDISRQTQQKPESPSSRGCHALPGLTHGIVANFRRGRDQDTIEDYLIYFTELSFKLKNEQHHVTRSRHRKPHQLHHVTFPAPQTGSQLKKIRTPISVTVSNQAFPVPVPTYRWVTRMISPNKTSQLILV